MADNYPVTSLKQVKTQFHAGSFLGYQLQQLLKTKGLGKYNYYGVEVVIYNIHGSARFGAGLEQSLEIENLWQHLYPHNIFFPRNFNAGSLMAPAWQIEIINPTHIEVILPQLKEVKIVKDYIEYLARKKYPGESNITIQKERMNVLDLDDNFDLIVQSPYERD